MDHIALRGVNTQSTAQRHTTIQAVPKLILFKLLKCKVKSNKQLHPSEPRTILVNDDAATTNSSTVKKLCICTQKYYKYLPNLKYKNGFGTQ